MCKFSHNECKFGDDCNKCHNVVEQQYHNNFYKTKVCDKGDKCTDLHCPYIHVG